MSGQFTSKLVKRWSFWAHVDCDTTLTIKPSWNTHSRTCDVIISTKVNQMQLNGLLSAAYHYGLMDYTSNTAVGVV